MNADRSIAEILEDGVSRDAEHPAIEKPDGPPMSYGALMGQIDRTGRQLREFGISPEDRVGIVLPNGPESATAFLAISCNSVAAPLNPQYRAQEFDFYLSDLGASAVVVPRDAGEVVRSVARAQGVPVLDLHRASAGPAGNLELIPAQSSVLRPPDSGAVGRPGLHAPALVLHTSGTTGTPKVVPLTHANLGSSANHVAASLALGPEDRCLNLMPLFHIHGLVAALLASLHAGGTVVCTPGFESEHFLKWFAELRPTWFTAVPTIHQAVLRSIRQSGPLPQHSLRMIRSSSASLPETVMQELEATFGVPAIEAYGMTEAAHQIASSPLPPGIRKPGSVGIPSGPEVMIVNDDGDELPVGQTGQVVIRGPNVTAGYEADGKVNSDSFADGWFRTGDLGRFDHDAYLFLAGRTKEIINRGGESISPREVDEALLAHPDIEDAAAFALPHPTLGEQVGAAVVLRKGATINTDGLRKFVAERISPHKVPTELVTVDQVPTGATGKVQRNSLATQLGLLQDGSKPAPVIATRDPNMAKLEQQLADIWSRVLASDNVSPNQDFTSLGGDSLSAVELYVAIEEQFNTGLSMGQIFSASTVRSQAQLIADGGHSELPSLVTIRSGGDGLPLFLVHGAAGTADVFYRLVAALPQGFPVFAFQARGIDGSDEPRKTIPEMAAAYIMDMKEKSPVGPYRIAGHSFGGTVAYEMAQQLTRAGDQVVFLGLFDTPRLIRRFPAPESPIEHLKRIGRKARFHLTLLASPDGAGGLRYLTKNLQRRRRGSPERTDASRKIHDINLAAEDAYPRLPYPGNLTLFRAMARPPNHISLPADGWAEVVQGEIRIWDIPGSHSDFITDHAPGLGAALTEALARL